MPLPFRGEVPIIHGEVIPTEAGGDLTSPLHSHDAHIRLEEGEIFIDVFDSSVENANEAHVESRNFSDDPAGAEEATDWLTNEWGFDVTVRPSRR